MSQMPREMNSRKEKKIQFIPLNRGEKRDGWRRMGGRGRRDERKRKKGRKNDAIFLSYQGLLGIKMSARSKTPSIPLEANECYIR